MKKNQIKNVSMNAMIACLYAVMTIAISPIAYGSLQFRVSEILVFLAFYNKKYIPGLVIGCFIANMASPMGVWDMCFGTAATLLATIAMNRSKNLLMAAFYGGLFNGIIVGAELYFAFGLPFIMNAVYVFAGEFIVLLLGIAVCHILEKNQLFMEKYILDEK